MLRVRVVFTSVIGGSPFLATHYFTGDDDASGAAAAVTAAGNFWGAVDALMDNETSWATEAEVAVLDNAGVLQGIESTTPVTGTGAVAGAALPKAAQALIRWQTSGFVGGRRLRGRTFVPSLTTAVINNGVLTSAAMTALDAAAEALIADVNTTLAIWSKTNSLSFPVTSATVWSEFATMRSRRD